MLKIDPPIPAAIYVEHDRADPRLNTGYKVRKIVFSKPMSWGRPMAGLLLGLAVSAAIWAFFYGIGDIFL